MCDHLPARAVLIPDFDADPEDVVPQATNGEVARQTHLREKIAKVKGDLEPTPGVSRL